MGASFGLVSLIFIICILAQTVLAQENGTQNISPLQGITATPQNTTFSESPQKSSVTQEDILIEAQRNFDRSLNILNMVATLMDVLVTILAVVIAIAGGLGFLEIKRWRETRKNIEDDAETTKKIVDFIKELRAKAESDVKVLRHEVESFPRPSLTEEPSSEVREKLAEFSHRLQTLEILGVSLKPEDYIMRGDDFYYRGTYELALKAYEKAIELKPDHADAWNNKSRALGGLGRHDESLKASEKAIELKPNHADAWNNKGVELYSLERYDEALTALEKAIELKPNDAAAWINKGAALTRLGRYDEALTALEKAIELKPNDAAALAEKGIALTRLGRYDEALTALEKAMELEPNDALVRYKLARFYSIKENKEKWFSNLKKAIELDKSYKEKAKTDKDFEKLWDDADFKKLVE